MNKYEKLLEYAISLYPDEVDISDGELRGGTGFWCKNISDAWHNAEDKDTENREDVNFMLWAIYGVLHRKCREDFAKGIYKVRLSDLSHEDIINKYNEECIAAERAEM